MPNAVLERLESQRAEQVAVFDSLMSTIDHEGRDLVPAEESLVRAARERIDELDRQITPLREFENLRAAAAGGSPFVPAGPPDERPMGPATAFAYSTAGAYIVDHLRARGDRRHNLPADQNAIARLQAAVQNQITTDTPGLLPTPIIGPVVNTIDASRPFITSIGTLPLPDAGAGFIRPKVTQHVDVGQQLGEKTELASRKMVISQVPFSKKTFGGVVDISRQDIDWTSPSAWDALVQDLADVYGAETEQTVANDFAALVTQTGTAPASNDLAGWAAALYEAASKCYMGGAVAGAIPMGRLPDRLWVSLDMWAVLGAIVDQARLVVGDPNLGSGQSLRAFAGDILSVPRIVVPSFPAQTVILGPSNMYEFRENTIGLLTAVEPSILGVEVAYGGYAAYGMLEANAYCKVPAPPAIPLTRTASK